MSNSWWPRRGSSGDGHDLLLTCQRMTLGEPDASGGRDRWSMEGSELVIECSTVIAAIGQAVDRSLPKRRAASDRLGHRRRRAHAGHEPARACLRAATRCWERIWRCAPWRRANAAASIDQYLRGEAVVGEARSAAVVFRPIDDAERAVIFRGIENGRARSHAGDRMERRLAGFDEVDRRVVRRPTPAGKRAAA